MSLNNSRNRLIAKSVIVLGLFLFLGALLWKVNLVIGRTASFPILGPFWGPQILQFLIVALAGFVFALPEKVDLHSVAWSRLVISGLPALFVAFAHVFYYRLTSSLGWLNMVFLFLSGGGGTPLFVSAGAFWFGGSLALSFEKSKEEQATKPKGREDKH